MNKVKVDFKKMYYGFPVFLISFYDENGNPNITTLSSSFSLGDMVCLGISSRHYSLNQIKKVKDFVINIPDRNLMKEIDICGYESGYKSQKFNSAGLTPIKSEVINAPIIDECNIAIECSLIEAKENEQFPGTVILLARVKGRQLNKNLLDENNHLQYSMMDPVLYLGDDSCRVYRYLEKDKADRFQSFLK